MGYRHWTEGEVKTLHKYYETEPTEWLAELLDRPISGIRQKARKEGLQVKDPVRFKKGQIPWNKGKSHRAGGRSVQTQFKKGQQPPTARKPGEMYQRDDHGTLYWYIKPKGARRCIAYHRYRWQQLHGEIPKGYIVTFKDGNPENIQDDNIICISRAENLRRNNEHCDKEMKYIRVVKSRCNLSIVDLVLQGRI